MIKSQHNFWICIDLAKLQLYFLEFSPLRKSKLAWAKRDILQETFRKRLWSSSQTLFSLDKKCCPLLCKPDSMSNQRNIIWLISNHFAPVVHTQCRHSGREKKNNKPDWWDVIILPGKLLCTPASWTSNEKQCFSFNFSLVGFIHYSPWTKNFRARVNTFFSWLCLLQSQSLRLWHSWKSSVLRKSFIELPTFKMMLINQHWQMLMQTLSMSLSALLPDPQGSMGLMQLENTLQ